MSQKQLGKLNIMMVPPQQNLMETINRLRSIYFRNEFARKKETEQDYWKMFIRLSGSVINSESKRTILKAAMETTSSRTWNKRRAAILFSCFFKIDRHLSELETANEYDRERLERQIWNYVHIIQAIPDGCPLENIKKSSSKKKVVRRLDHDWREQMIKHIDPKYQLDLVLFALTGCRPSELARGIDAVVTSDRKLLVTIKTSKVTDSKIVIKDKILGTNKLVDYQAGQERRTLIFNLDQDNQFMLKLFEIRFKTNDERNPKLDPDKSFRVNVAIANEKTLASKITRLGKKLFPDITENITPYCFRHQLATDLKSNGVDGDEISLYLGHAVDTTKEKYGFILPTKGARNNTPAGVETVLRLNDPTSINQLKKGRQRSKQHVTKLRNTSPKRSN